MNNIAIIPARSGSKGLKDKNIKLLGDKPLIWYSVQAALGCGYFEEVMVSTDSASYAEIAKECGASVPFLRSAERSGDQAGSWDVVREVLGNYRKDGKLFDTVCLLQPTSPLRTAEDIADAYRLMEAKDADAVTGVCEVDHSPLWTMTLPEDGSLTAYRKTQKDMPRQMLDTYYRINGAIYIRRILYGSPGEEAVVKLNGNRNGTQNRNPSENRNINLNVNSDRDCQDSSLKSSCGTEGIVLKDACEYALIMERNRSIDIDTIEDFEYAEFLLQKQPL